MRRINAAYLATCDREVGEYAVLLVFVSRVRLQALGSRDRFSGTALSSDLYSPFIPLPI